MPRENEFWVYVMANLGGTASIEVTNAIEQRIREHIRKQGDKGTAFSGHRLVYFERFQNAERAIARQSQIRHWSRARKFELIRYANPRWEDLSRLLMEDIEFERGKADWRRKYSPSGEGWGAAIHLSPRWR